MQRYDIVVPTVGRDSLAGLLADLAAAPAPGRGEVIVVDDRLRPGVALDVSAFTRVVAGGGRGPAHARNVGWRAGSSPWVVFLDDDVRLEPGWADQLQVELAGAAPCVGGVQGRVEVPCVAGRRPTDWERNVAGLEGARWVTADMAYRRGALEQAAGFDEAFPRAFREDADLALRVLNQRWRLEQGKRTVRHPVRTAGRLVSVRVQVNNADDARMRARHGRAWRRRAGAESATRLALHVCTTAGALGAISGALAGTRRVACVAGLCWVALFAEFVWRRVAPGPRSRGEIVTMLATSALIPPVATFHRLRGEWAVRRHGSELSEAVAS
jgi:glycosyltransferase involved in cell wall biosynthesis